MTVQLYEGCWGVTRVGKKRGPMQAENESDYEFSTINGSYRADGRFGYGHEKGEIWPTEFDIVRVFATEDKADACLAGEKHLGPLFKEEYAKLVAAGETAAAPKPVTWPDGVTEMQFGSGRDNITIAGGYIKINDGMVSFKPTEARQLAALLLAAADKVEGRG